MVNGVIYELLISQLITRYVYYLTKKGFLFF